MLFWNLSLHFKLNFLLILIVRDGINDSFNNMVSKMGGEHFYFFQTWVCFWFWHLLFDLLYLFKFIRLAD